MANDRKVIERNGQNVILFELNNRERADVESYPTRAEKTKRLIQLIAPDFMVRNVEDTGMNVIVGLEQEIKKYDLVFEQEIEFLKSSKVPHWSETINPAAKTVEGIALKANLSMTDKFIADLALECNGNKGWMGHIKSSAFLPSWHVGGGYRSDAPYTPILNAMLNNMPIAAAQTAYNKRGRPILSISGHIEIYLFNPTKDRVMEAAKDFRTFIDYSKEVKGDLIEIAGLINRADMIEELEPHKGSGKAKKFVQQEINRFYEKADEIFSHLKLPDFSRLAKKTLYSTNTGGYSSETHQ